MTEEERWSITVVRAQGLRLMLPDKSWRPVVTLEVDNRATHETILGVDGQNPNLKQGLTLYDLRLSSVLEMKVWHILQGKKNGKNRRLVASSRQTLNELMQSMRIHKAVRSISQYTDVKLTCQSCKTRSTTLPSSKGRPQNGALLTLRVVTPTSPASPVDSQDTQRTLFEDQESSGSCSSSEPTAPPTPPESISDIIEVEPASPVAQSSPVAPNVFRRRRKKHKKHSKGYLMLSDHEHTYDSANYSGDESEGSSAASPSFLRSSQSELESQDPPDNSLFDTPLGSLFDLSSEQCLDTPPEHIPSHTVISTSTTQWFTASLLPQHTLDHSKPPVPPYTETIEVYEPVDLRMSWWERFIATFTMYAEIRDARMDSEFEAIFQRMRMEWTFIGTLLAGLAAVNTTVMSISPDSTIPLSPTALRATASSSIFTGLGIAATAYFILRYSFSPVDVFRSRALDVYSSYFFFAISSRVPTLCMVASAVCLMAFLGLVAFDVWPRGVVAVCFLVGIVMSLQFLVFGFHQLGKGIVGGGKRVVRVSRGVVRKMTGAGNIAPDQGTPASLPQKRDSKAVGTSSFVQ
ncbi:hypothetical protein FA15DRAFT_695183 [Coprinopsis marcescibilis]|uniref:Uncharacterized protein n=1 Tax=Coprinopsis marcescibilis TaxID=230819 RepID=A0A5C3L4X7_COPMA|nr:hypothetical protein FA15DRAFT_695183 [Coprinopsis marcescibilis]